MKKKFLTVLIICSLAGTAMAYTWQEETSPVAFDLSDVWAANSDVAYAVGFGGIILKRENNNWSQMSHSVSVSQLLSVWGSNVNDVWAVGTGGVTMHYDGTAWSKVVSNTSALLLDVEGYESSRIFAAGGTKRNRYLQWDPYSTEPNDAFTWSQWTTPGQIDFMINALSAIDRDEIWLGGYRSPSDPNAVMQKWDGANWTEYTDGSGRKVTDIDGGGNNVVAVGLYNLVLHFDGNQWQDVNEPDPNMANSHWRGAHVSGTGEVYACGDRGYLLRWDGSAWNTDLYLNDANDGFQAVDSAGSSAWVVGLKGKIYKAEIPETIGAENADIVTDGIVDFKDFAKYAEDYDSN